MNRPVPCELIGSGGPCGADVEILDDGEAGFGTTGSWSTSTNQGYQGDVRHSATGSGTDKAAWTFAGLTPGTYRVAATWYPHSNRATDSPFTVFDGGTALGTVRVNQELSPDDFSDAGAVWETLGEFTISGDTLVVQLSDEANEYVIADAIRIELVGRPVTFAYGAEGNLSSRTDELGRTTVWEYDGLGRRVHETLPDPDGVREFDYDRLGRVVEERWKDGAATVNTITSVYNDAGLLASESDSESSASYAYDRLDRVLTVSHGGTPGVVFTFGYDAVGNALSRSETIGGNAAGTNTYVYDGLDRVTRIEQSGTGVTDKRVDLVYNALGQYTTITRYADLAGTQQVATSSYGYDLTHRLTSLTHDLAVSPDVAYTWQYDAASRIVGMTSPDGSNTLSYDTAGQLTGATLTSESYTYDGTGNRTNSGYSTGDNNRLLSDGTYSYTYDDEGNRTSRTETATGAYVEYAWDHRNRLTQVTFRTSSGGSITKRIEYDYDTADRRISKRVYGSGGTTLVSAERFVYTGGNVGVDDYRAWCDRHGFMEWL